MLKVSLVIHEDVVLSAVAGVIDMLEAVNKLRSLSGQAPAFKLELVSEKVKNVQLDVPAQFLCYTTMADTEQTDLIIVPSYKPDYREVLKKNQAVVDWIVRMHQAGTEVASLCIGSFFLAEAGLLNGKEATSHWMVTDEMQMYYPLINVKSDKVITDQNGVYTSGGAFSSLKLILYLIEKFCGRETAVWTSKRFSVELENNTQSHFAVFTGQHQHNDAEILKTQLFIEKNFAKDLTVEEVSAMTSTGKRNFLRRFKAATNNTPLEYMQRVRIEAAKKAIEEEEPNLDQLMRISGYKDVKTFRMIFKRLTGLSPQEYRKKYSRLLATA